MAIKRYPLRYVKTYEYKDKESGQIDKIVFMANGYLFPLFKSLAGIELGQALKEYKQGLLGIINDEVITALAKFEAAPSADEKFNVVAEDPAVWVKAFAAAQDTQLSDGLSLTELLLIVMHVCALPEEEHAEALSIGYELLPEEVYHESVFVLELLNLAMQYEQNAKKNSTYPKR